MCCCRRWCRRKGEYKDKTPIIKVLVLRHDHDVVLDDGLMALESSY
jgi:hypothetical protein